MHRLGKTTVSWKQYGEPARQIQNPVSHDGMTTPSRRHFAKEGLFISADARAMPMGRSSGEYSNLALQGVNSGLGTNCMMNIDLHSLVSRSSDSIPSSTSKIPVSKRAVMLCPFKFNLYSGHKNQRPA